MRKAGEIIIKGKYVNGYGAANAHLPEQIDHIKDGGAAFLGNWWDLLYPATINIATERDVAEIVGLRKTTFAYWIRKLKDGRRVYFRKCRFMESMPALLYKCEGSPWMYRNDYFEIILFEKIKNIPEEIVVVI